MKHADDGAGIGKRAGTWLGALAFVGVLFIPFNEALSPAAQRTAAVAALMSVWWITEAVPLAVTALVPLAAFPLLGVMSPEAAAAPFANPIVFLFLGGFLLAIAMERWNLHRRMALAIVGAVGMSPARLVLGFMCATAFLSMWVSNTATAAMMLPIGIALAQLMRPAGHEGPFPFGTALMLGIAYAASIGGLGTLIGTPPNALLAAAAGELLGRPIGFLEWMMVGVPLVVLLLPLTWTLLVHVLFRPGPLPEEAKQLVEQQRAGLGRITRAERLTAAVFALAAAGWLLREPKQLGAVRLPGLTDIAPGIDDSTIAIAAALLLFLLPARWRERQFLLDWRATAQLPWGVLLLFGGGLSLARAFETSGLTAAIGGALGGLATLPGWLLVAAVVAAFVFLSELASNTAIAAMAMPLLASAGAQTGAGALALMVAGALAASTAFMLPVGTPPNAIAFGTGYIGMRQMVRAGFWLDLVAIVLVTIVATLIVPRVL